MRDAWSNATSCNYFVGPWPPFIVGLPYNYLYPSCSRQLKLWLLSNGQQNKRMPVCCHPWSSVSLNYASCKLLKLTSRKVNIRVALNWFLGSGVYLSTSCPQIVLNRVVSQYINKSMDWMQSTLAQEPECPLSKDVFAADTAGHGYLLLYSWCKLHQFCLQITGVGDCTAGQEWETPSQFGILYITFTALLWHNDGSTPVPINRNECMGWAWQICVHMLFCTMCAKFDNQLYVYMKQLHLRFWQLLWTSLTIVSDKFDNTYLLVITQQPKDF